MEKLHDNKYTIQDLLKLIGMLKFSDMFHWGKRNKQHADMKTGLIENAYDVLEAIDLEDSRALEEKLGELLLQIVHHCSIEEENNFSFNDVVDFACRKLISKYPHVFSYGRSKLSDEKCRVYRIRNHGKKFRSIEEDTNLNENPVNEIENVSKTLPALVRTSKVQNRAARLGYGLFSVEDALNETFERLHYLESLIFEGRQEYYGKEIGNLLFSVTEIARLLDIDAESSLCNSCERFKNEFLCKLSLENRDKV